VIRVIKKKLKIKKVLKRNELVHAFNLSLNKKEKQL
jgi:hypothetical protein